jgi:hypothetical protein
VKTREELVAEIRLLNEQLQAIPTSRKYKVGDVVLMKGTITFVSNSDMAYPYSIRTPKAILPTALAEEEILGLA